MGTRGQRFIADFFDATIQHDARLDRAVGRDPRQLSAAELARLGHGARTPLQALRATCLAHLGTAPKVRACAASACPAWPFRMGTHPFKKKSDQTTEQKRAAVARLAGARAAKAAKRALQKNSAAK